MSAVCPCPCNSTAIVCRVWLRVGKSCPNDRSMVAKPPGSSTRGCPAPRRLVIHRETVHQSIVTRSVLGLFRGLGRCALGYVVAHAACSCGWEDRILASGLTVTDRIGTREGRHNGLLKQHSTEVRSLLLVSLALLRKCLGNRAALGCSRPGHGDPALYLSPTWSMGNGSWELLRGDGATALQAIHGRDHLPPKDLQRRNAVHVRDEADHRLNAHACQPAQLSQ